MGTFAPRNAWMASLKSSSMLAELVPFVVRTLAAAVGMHQEMTMDMVDMKAYMRTHMQMHMKMEMNMATAMDMAVEMDMGMQMERWI